MAILIAALGLTMEIASVVLMYQQRHSPEPGTHTPPADRLRMLTIPGLFLTMGGAMYLSRLAKQRKEEAARIATP
jgi:hypothetical protein